MRIAMIGQKGMPAIYGGVERHVHELSVRLVQRGHKVTVYSRPWYTKDNKTESVDGVNIKSLPSIHSKHLDTITHTFLATIYAIFGRYDVIHYHGVGPSLWSWLARIFTPQSLVIVTFHSIDRKHEKWGGFARWVLKTGERTTCRFPHQTIAVSRTIQQYVRDVYDKEALFVPNGVPAYKKNQQTDKIDQWNLISQSYILVVSRLIPHKGIHYAIQAYKQLKEKHPELVENLPLVITGGGYYTDKYVESLKQLARDEDQIIFTGSQSGEELSQLFSNAKLMIHPSDNEGLPITVLEAMSYGLPVLVSDIPEHRELVTERTYNFWHGDVDSLEEKLKALIKKDDEVLTMQGIRNQAMVNTLYNWDNIIDNLMGVYASKAPVGTTAELPQTI